MRDNDKTKVYEAEFATRDLSTYGGTVELHGNRMTLPIERKFASLDSIQTYVDAVLNLNWVRAAWPESGGVRVVKRKGIAYATYRHATREMRINDTHDGMWALREIVVLHELSHHLMFATHGFNDKLQSHGVEFRAIFLAMVEELIGPEIAWILRMQYMERGLSVVPTQDTEMAAT